MAVERQVAVITTQESIRMVIVADVRRSLAIIHAIRRESPHTKIVAFAVGLWIWWSTAAA